MVCATGKYEVSEKPCSPDDRRDASDRAVDTAFSAS